jgi:hypothetical protein
LELAFKRDPAKFVNYAILGGRTLVRNNAPCSSDEYRTVFIEAVVVERSNVTGARLAELRSQLREILVSRWLSCLYHFELNRTRLNANILVFIDHFKVVAAVACALAISLH